MLHAPGISLVVREADASARADVVEKRNVCMHIRTDIFASNSGADFKVEVRHLRETALESRFSF